MKKALMVLLGVMLCFGLVFVSCGDDPPVEEQLVIFEAGEWAVPFVNHTIVKSSDPRYTGDLTIVGQNLRLDGDASVNVIFDEIFDASSYYKLVFEITARNFSTIWWFNGGLLADSGGESHDEFPFVGGAGNTFNNGVLTLEFNRFDVTEADKEVFDPSLFRGFFIGSATGGPAITITKIYLVRGEGSAPPPPPACIFCGIVGCNGSCLVYPSTPVTIDLISILGSGGTWVETVEESEYTPGSYAYNIMEDVLLGTGETMVLGDKYEVSMKFTATRANNGPNFSVTVIFVDTHANAQPNSYWSPLAPQQTFPVNVDGTTVNEISATYVINHLSASTLQNTLTFSLSGGGEERHITYNFTEFTVKRFKPQ